MTEKTENLEKIILTEISKNPSFIRCDVPSIFPASTEMGGVFEAVFLLSDLHKWTELTSKKDFRMGGVKEESDQRILKALDSLAMKGLLDIYQVELRRDMSHRDIRFMSVIGEGTRTSGTSDVKKTVTRDFSTKPLSKEERDKRKSITNPSEIVKKIRKNRDKSFQGMMGKPSNTNLVSEQKAAMKEQEKVRKEDQQFKADIHIIANWIKSEKESEKNAKNKSD